MMNRYLPMEIAQKKAFCDRLSSMGTKRGWRYAGGQSFSAPNACHSWIDREPEHDMEKQDKAFALEAFAYLHFIKQ